MGEVDAGNRCWIAGAIRCELRPGVLVVLERPATQVAIWRKAYYPYFGKQYAPRIYWPLGRVSLCGPRPIRIAIGWYATLRYEDVMVPFDWRGTGWIGTR